MIDKEKTRVHFDKFKLDEDLLNIDYGAIKDGLKKEFERLGLSGHFSEEDLSIEGTEAWQEFMDTVAQTVAEVSQILNIDPIPEIELPDLPGDTSGIAMKRDDKDLLLLDFKLIATFFLEDRGGSSPKSNLKRIIAHEFFHFYIIKFYRKAAFKTGLANKMEEEWDYPLDRGELACNLFAIDYLSQEFEKTVPEIKNDKAEAEFLLRKIKTSRSLAKKNKKIAMRNKRTQELLMKFPWTRIPVKIMETFLGNKKL
jgi:hypothetical protein